MEFADKNKRGNSVNSLERLTSKVAVGRITPRELVQLLRALKAIAPIKAIGSGAANETLNKISKQLNPCLLIAERIEKEIQADPPLLIAKGNVIANGVDAELDELRRIAFSGKDYLLQIQQKRK